MTDDIDVIEDVAEAAEAYEDFHGFPASYIDTYDELPDVFFRVGDCVGVVYEVIEDGRRVRYQHDFEARPTLAVSFDGQTAVILRGEWQFTDKGFEG
jgi:hypothetical protein